MRGRDGSRLWSSTLHLDVFSLRSGRTSAPSSEAVTPDIAAACTRNWQEGVRNRPLEALKLASLYFLPSLPFFHFFPVLACADSIFLSSQRVSHFSCGTCLFCMSDSPSSASGFHITDCAEKPFRGCWVTVSLLHIRPTHNPNDSRQNILL